MATPEASACPLVLQVVALLHDAAAPALDSQHRQPTNAGLELTDACAALQVSYKDRILNTLPATSTAELDLTLWKYGFYHHIETYRRRCQPGAAAQPEFRVVLDRAMGFFLDLLRDITMRWPIRALAFVGLPALETPVVLDEATVFEPRATCHRCLLWLGDVARYIEQYTAPGHDLPRTYAVARIFYERARVLRPAYGAPHNQLAVLAMGTLPAPGAAPAIATAAYHYIRSLRAPWPFPTAGDNLARLVRQLPPLSISGPPLHPLLAAVACLTGNARALDSARMAWRAALDAPRYSALDILSTAVVFQHCVVALGPPGRLQLDGVFVDTVVIAERQKWPDRLTAVAHLMLGWLQLRLQTMPAASDLGAVLAVLGSGMTGLAEGADPGGMLPEERFARGFACERVPGSAWAALDSPPDASPTAVVDAELPAAQHRSARARRVMTMLVSLHAVSQTWNTGKWAFLTANSSEPLVAAVPAQLLVAPDSENDDHDFDAAEVIVFGKQSAPLADRSLFDATPTLPSSIHGWAAKIPALAGPSWAEPTGLSGFGASDHATSLVWGTAGGLLDLEWPVRKF